MFGKLARSFGVVALAAAPFMMLGTPSASATGGCAVDNASTSTHLQVTVEIPPIPPAITISWSSYSCSYVTGGGTVNYSCTLAAGRCQVLETGVTRGNCITEGLTTCHGSFQATAGDTITLEVIGGSGQVADAV